MGLMLDDSARRLQGSLRWRLSGSGDKPRLGILATSAEMQRRLEQQIKSIKQERSGAGGDARGSEAQA